MPLGKELGRVKVQVVALRAEMVVDHVQEDHQAPGVGGLHQPLEVLGVAVSGGRGERQGTVVAPAAPAGEGGHRHQLEGVDAERLQVIEVS